MAEPKKAHKVRHEPHGRRDRDSADDRPHKHRTDRPAGEREADAARIEADETFAPDRDGTGF